MKIPKAVTGPWGRVTRATPWRAAMVGLLLAMTSAGWAQTTYYVAETGDDGRTGTGNWTNALATISNAVGMAVGKDLILVSNGVYTVTQSLVIVTNITVRGLGAPTGAVIRTLYPDAAYSTRCARVNSTGAVFEGFTVENGYPAASDTYKGGGGIYLQAGLVTNCLIRLCTVQTNGGGGVLLTGAGSIVSDCTILSNQYLGNASYMGGGGVAVVGGATLKRSLVQTNYALNFGSGGVRAENATIADCTILDNWVTTHGGGVGVYNGTARLTSCIVSNNRSSSHNGGIAVGYGGVVLAVDCTIANNIALSSAAGVYAMGVNGRAVLSNCVISCNSAGTTGGGAANSAGTATIGSLDVIRCRVVGNSAVNGGGGIWVRNKSANSTVIGCVIASNVSQYGAGIYADDAQTNTIMSLTVRNCLLVGNRATSTSLGRGGGLYLGTGICEVSACTLASNFAHVAGGGIYMHTTARPEQIQVWNSLVVANGTNAATNAAANLALSTADLTNTLYFVGSPLLTNTAQGQLADAPVFAGDGDYHLSPNSPGVNAGTNQAWMDAAAVDLDGKPRVDRLFRRADMGCYEYQPVITLFQTR